MTPKHLDDIERAVERMQSAYFESTLATHDYLCNPTNEQYAAASIRCRNIYEDTKLAYQDAIARARAPMATE